MFQPDFAASGRGMHKAAFTHINAGMGWHIVLRKKHQIARAKIVLWHWVSPIAQLGHGAWRHNAGTGFENVGNQAAAVKTTVRRVAAIAVRGSNQAKGVNSDVISLLLGGSWRHGGVIGEIRAGV